VGWCPTERVVVKVLVVMLYSMSGTFPKSQLAGRRESWTEKSRRCISRVTLGQWSDSGMSSSEMEVQKSCGPETSFPTTSVPTSSLLRPHLGGLSIRSRDLSNLATQGLA
jgi:hypothetical protein